jgi:GNAT superfamily N-acetyltransferase
MLPDPLTIESDEAESCSELCSSRGNPFSTNGVPLLSSSQESKKGDSQTVAPSDATDCELQILDTRAELPHSLIESYKRIFEGAAAFREKNSDEHAEARFRKMDLLIVARLPLDDGRVVGFVGGRNLRMGELTGDEDKIRAYRILEVLANDRVFVIAELGVLKEYEGSGVGSRLLEALLGHVRALGNHAYTLVSAGHRAISFYRRHGFSFLTDCSGLLRRKVEQMRTDSAWREDLRPRLYRVDEFIKVKLKNGKEVYLELFRPQSLKHKESLRPAAQRISELFGRAFWHSDNPEECWPVESIMKRLPQMLLLILAFDESYQAVGYSMFNVVRWRNEDVLFADSGGVAGGSPAFSENWQKSGLGLEMLKEALRQVPAQIMVARTQNAVIPPMLRKLDTRQDQQKSPLNRKPIEIIPVDSDYSEDDKELLRAVASQMPNLASNPMEVANGINKEVYGEGMLGDYADYLPSETLLGFDKRMRQMDPSWSKERGDAVMLIAKNVPWISYSGTKFSRCHAEGPQSEIQGHTKQGSKFSSTT